MGKMMPPNVRIDWVPLAGLTTPSAPKASEINLGTNVSGAIEAGYRLSATDSDVDNSKTIIDEGNVDTPTIGNYEAMITLFQDEIGAGTNASPENPTIFTTAFNLWKAGRVEGWLIKRLGKKSSVAHAAGDVVSVYRVINDIIREKDADKGAPTKVEIEFGPQGSFWQNVVEVA